MSFAAFLSGAKTIITKWWKWILGGLIALVVIFTAWRLRRQAAEIDRLRGEVAKDRELVQDLQVRIQAEKNTALAKALQDEVAHIQADVMGREAGIQLLEQQYADAKKKVDDAKNWKDLDNQAKPK